jgi:hypothetical protein
MCSREFVISIAPTQHNQMPKVYYVVKDCKIKRLCKIVWKNLRLKLKSKKNCILLRLRIKLKSKKNLRLSTLVTLTSSFFDTTLKNTKKKNKL